jgi:hypothetical protein
MDGSGVRLPFSLDEVAGTRILSAHRVLYRGVDGRYSDYGALELCVGARTLLFDGAADGESLRVHDRPWVDPFAEPMSEENRRYVQEHGKWERVDCSAEKPYEDFIGQEITDVIALVNEFGRIAGVRISVRNCSLWFAVDGDESRVYTSRPSGFREVR